VTAYASQLPRLAVGGDDGVEPRLRLRYEGLHHAVGRGHGGPVNGFTQICRVTGSISLNGDDLAVDCHELRAGFWGNRSDLRFPPAAGGNRPGHAGTMDPLARYLSRQARPIPSRCCPHLITTVR
jgi:hypothetical protein